MIKRMSIALDEELLKAVPEPTGQRTKRAAVEAALKAYVRGQRIQDLIEMAGSGAVDWDLEDLLAYRALELEENQGREQD